MYFYGKNVCWFGKHSLCWVIEGKLIWIIYERSISFCWIDALWIYFLFEILPELSLIYLHLRTKILSFCIESSISIARKTNRFEYWWWLPTDELRVSGFFTGFSILPLFDRTRRIIYLFIKTYMMPLNGTEHQIYLKSTITTLSRQGRIQIIPGPRDPPDLIFPSLYKFMIIKYWILELCWYHSVHPLSSLT